MALEIDKYLGKRYKLKSSENFDEYLKAIDVGLISRKLATSLSPSTELTKSDDASYSLTFVTPIRTVTITFKLGEEFSEERADGIKVKSMMYMEGDKLVQSQVEDSGRKSIHIREFSDTSLIVLHALSRIYNSILNENIELMPEWDPYPQPLRYSATTLRRSLLCNLKQTSTVDGWDGKCVRVYELA